MEKAEVILNQILEVYNTPMENDQKHRVLSELWTRYYKLAKEEGISLDQAYRLYLLGENESFILDQPPEEKKVDQEMLQKSVEHVRQIISSGAKTDGLEKEEIEALLDWSVQNTRKEWRHLGLDVQTNSLNGLCEMGQALSLLPFENLGLVVTKNQAEDCFSYPLHHCFGTVTFPKKETPTDSVATTTYLIDTTYRQFFTTVRCNAGRYDTLEENKKIPAAPDPGYFIEDEQFARELLKKGYILLTEENARKYGEAFERAGRLSKEEIEASHKDYLQSILTHSSDYQIPMSELEGMNLSFPEERAFRK